MALLFLRHTGQDLFVGIFHGRGERSHDYFLGRKAVLTRLGSIIDKKVEPQVYAVLHLQQLVEQLSLSLIVQG